MNDAEFYGILLAVGLPRRRMLRVYKENPSPAEVGQIVAIDNSRYDVYEHRWRTALWGFCHAAYSGTSRPWHISNEKYKAVIQRVRELRVNPIDEGSDNDASD